MPKKIIYIIIAILVLLLIYIIILKPKSKQEQELPVSPILEQKSIIPELPGVTKTTSIDVTTSKVKEYIEKLKSENFDERDAAINSLAQLGKEAVIQLKDSLLSDKNSIVRMTSAYLLGVIKDKEAVPVLLKCLNDSDFGVRERVIVALGEIKENSTILHLKKLLNDKDKYIRCLTASALGKMNDKSGLKTVESLVLDKDDYIACAAINAIADIGDKSSLPLLIKLAKLRERNENISINKAIQNAMQKMNVKKPLSVVVEKKSSDELKISLENDIKYYQKICKAKSLTSNDKIFMLNKILAKYKDLSLDLTFVKNEIEKLKKNKKN